MSKREQNWFEETLQDEDFEHRGARAGAAPYLVVVDGRRPGHRFALDRERLTIGRSPEADIVLADERTSRIHAVVTSHEGVIKVVDNGSRNGIYLDEVRVEEAELTPDSSLRIGRTVLRLDFKSAMELLREEELFRAATTDPLTRIANRRLFEEQAGVAMAHAGRTEAPLAAVLLDVDHFKAVNDSHGHPAGDAVLVALAEVLREQKRQDDLLCRYGGEEFLFLLQQTDPREALAFAERLRETVAQKAFVAEGTSLPVTVSVGVAIWTGGEDLHGLVLRADQALYLAKQGGRNRVECA